jgi:membrane protease YdiL (CAAX protease family)
VAETPGARPPIEYELFPTNEWREVLFAYVLIVGGIGLTAHAMPGWVQQYSYSIMLAAMVYAPVLRSDKFRRPLRVIGIRLSGYGQDLKLAALVGLIVFPLFGVGFHLFHTVFLGQNFQPTWPVRSVPYLFLEHILFIALPEEVFYRGWMQTVLSKRIPARVKIWGGEFGLSVWITSTLFALGHLAATPSPGRLAVFFPSLLFGWLRSRSNGLIAPILIHGLANVLMAALSAWYK